MQRDDLVDAVRVWHNQVQELPSGALLLHIDATPFSGSKATETAVLHLRAVTITCPVDRDRNKLLLAQLKVANAVDDTSLKAAEEMIGWVWPRHAGAAGSVQDSDTEGTGPRLGKKQRSLRYEGAWGDAQRMGSMNTNHKTGLVLAGAAALAIQSIGRKIIQAHGCPQRRN